MSATNATPIINLPLFIGTDKPAWLTDWNGAMNIIDTSIAALQTAESGTASSLATLAQSVTALSGTVEQHTTALQTVTEATATNTGSINTINSLIGNGTPTTTDQTIIGAINEINAKTGDVKMVKIDEMITVTADGVKTMAQLGNELATAYSDLVRTSSSSHVFEPVFVKIDTTNGYANSPANVGGNSVVGIGFNALIALSDTELTQTALRLHTTLAENHIVRVVASDSGNVVQNRSSLVPTSGATCVLHYNEYVKA